MIQSQMGTILPCQLNGLRASVHIIGHNSVVREGVTNIEDYGFLTGEETVVIAVSRARHGAGDVVAEGPAISIAVWSRIHVCGKVGQEDCHVLSNVVHDLAGRRYESCNNDTTSSTTSRLLDARVVQG